MNRIIETVMQRRELVDSPPVLVDVGASGAIHSSWQIIAPYSICLAFDADARDFDVRQDSGYKSLITIGKLLLPQASEAQTFYLTQSPHCSSTLEPDTASLASWCFANLFNVEREVTLAGTDLLAALEGAGLDRVDWFKTDSQGIDLSLFKSLGDKAQQVLAAEFEPGIIDSYKGEDKLWKLMSYMDEAGFWMDALEVKGSQRISPKSLPLLTPMAQKHFSWFQKSSPGWGEVSYLRKENEDMDLRQYLLLWVIATIKRQHGFGLEICQSAYEKFSDPIFLTLREASIDALRLPVLTMVEQGLAKLRRRCRAWLNL